MTRAIAARLCALGALLALGACGSSEAEPKLMFLRGNTNGPDEFSILPTKPLEMPASLEALPAPTPGAPSRTDPTPFADAAAALGGNAAVKDRPSGDGALVAYAARGGVDPSVRTTLAGEDLAWRRENDGRLLEKLFKVSVYYRAYGPMSLDQQAEIERWRAAGVPTPSAPPPPGLLE